MKRYQQLYRLSTCAIILMLTTAVYSFASETYTPPPVEQSAKKGDQMWHRAVTLGEKLFEDSNLGRNGKSCSTCHDGSKLKYVNARYPKFVDMADRVVTLGHMINLCLNGALKGKELPLDSTKSVALQAYLRTFH